MSSLLALRQAKTLSDVALLLNVEPKVLSFALYIIPDAKKYTSFEIRKKNGGTRQILAPTGLLKNIQLNLARFLEACEAEITKERDVTQNNNLAHGFKVGYSIASNAKAHRNKRFVFNVDLKDFFPSITFGRVYGFFLKNDRYKLNSVVATIVSQIACHNNSLPQGSPCSPIISNIIANVLDIHLNTLSRRHRCTYTRYADDLTFSTNEKHFPSAIAVIESETGDKWIAGDGLVSRIFRHGYRLNHSKTRMQYRASRQDVTGLVVNEKLNISTDYYHLVRAMCHQLFNTGTSYDIKNGVSFPVSDDRLRGMLNHVYFIKTQANERPYPSQASEPAFSRLYADFLNYISFYGIEQPTIIGEGVTDTIYLKAAINRLAARYPSLLKSEDGKTSIAINFFRYGKTSRLVQDLSGGTGELKNLLGSYRKKISKFKYGGKQPVIILVDNDSGTKHLFAVLKEITGKKVDGSEPFYYAYANLYVVPVPKSGNGNDAIEGLFPPALLTTIYKGKTLDPTNKETDGDKVYSKHTFAKQVVRAGQNSIDFSGFTPLLDAIVAVKEDYKNRIAAAATP